MTTYACPACGTALSAEDRFCDLADQIVKVRSERSRWFGPGQDGINLATDFGYRAVENRVHVHDLHATMLALLGFDHTRLTYRYAGRDYRLTDVSGTVVRDIIA